MLVIPPTVYQPGRSQRPRKGSATPVPVAQTITVLSVYVPYPLEPWWNVWVFSEAVTATAIPLALRIRQGTEWIEAIYVDASGIPSEEVTLFYDVSEPLTDCVWEIATTPTGIAEAARIVVPQSGIVVES